MSQTRRWSQFRLRSVLASMAIASLGFLVLRETGVPSYLRKLSGDSQAAPVSRELIVCYASDLRAISLLVSGGEHLEGLLRPGEFVDLGVVTDSKNLSWVELKAEVQFAKRQGDALQISVAVLPETVNQVTLAAQTPGVTMFVWSNRSGERFPARLAPSRLGGP